MRPVPSHLPDELLVPECQRLIDGPADEALSNPAVRAAVQAAVRAQIEPRNYLSRRRANAHKSPAGATGKSDEVDRKRLASGDSDED
ncbi:hypothetical protein [Burkholderia gladioli]|uniref:hypothetical protein n=1 Tax=Burkholderia gladioli TaxID=28095 RepID=UPI001641E036|nr:hypothetical protein [Burkholderia gladioli]